MTEQTRNRAIVLVGIVIIASGVVALRFWVPKPWHSILVLLLLALALLGRSMSRRRRGDRGGSGVDVTPRP